MQPVQRAPARRARRPRLRSRRLGRATEFRPRPPHLRLAPYGLRDLVVQLGLWVVLGLSYEAVRGTAGDDRGAAFAHGRDLIHAERALDLLFEPRLERLVLETPSLADAVRWSYWASEFGVLIAALVWAYARNRAVYGRFRDVVLVANALGLLGYLVFPTAPPRLYRAAGFSNALSGQPRPTHASGLIGFAANPYAAMPSIHVADALIVGIFLALLARRPAVRVLWLLWPLWVAFTVLATANHFWLDVVGGVVVVVLGLLAAELVRRPGFAVHVPGKDTRDSDEEVRP